MFDKSIGVFFGGKNPEHDISIFTGEMIIKGLLDAGFKNVIPVYINKSGNWLIGKELGDIKIFRKGELEKYSKLSKWNLDNEIRGKMIFYNKGFLKKKIVIDIAFPALHGMNGEDGTIQGLFDMFDIPYIGCDVYSSAVSMDKVLTKQIYKANNISTSQFTFFLSNEWKENKQNIIKNIEKELVYPLFVKPSRLGSSIGINKVNSRKDIEFAIEVALHYDSKVIVEKAVENLKDITCCLIGNENPTPSLLQESAYNKDFVSFDDKYIEDGGTQFGISQQKVIIPAELDNKITQEIREMAKKIFKLIGCSGIARVDFLYDKKAKQYFANEINTLPGILYRHLWKKSGIELDDLLKKLVDFAIKRYEDKKKYTYTFESEVLKSDKSSKLKLGF